jgi:hypothetical protein
MAMMCVTSLATARKECQTGAKSCKAGKVACRIDNTVELGLGNKAQFQRGGLQRGIVVHRVVSGLRRLVVTDDGRQRGHSMTERSTYSLIFFGFGLVPRS